MRQNLGFTNQDISEIFNYIKTNEDISEIFNYIKTIKYFCI